MQSHQTIHISSRGLHIMYANFKKLFDVMYWTVVPIIMIITTGVALDGISSPSTARLILGILTLTMNSYVIYTYVRLLIEKLSNFFSKENTNA